MICFYQAASLAPTRWHNGGGITREIISFPPHQAAFDFRFSIATLSGDGDFSRFPGVDRTITLLRGDGVTLHLNRHTLKTLQPGIPFYFPGEQAVRVTLSESDSDDFNIMVRRDRYRATAGTSQSAHCLKNSLAGVVYVLSGQWHDGRQALNPGEGVWWHQQVGNVIPLTSDAHLLWGSVNRNF